MCYACCAPGWAPQVSRSDILRSHQYAIQCALHCRIWRSRALLFIGNAQMHDQISDFKKHSCENEFEGEKMLFSVCQDVPSITWRLSRKILVLLLNLAPLLYRCCDRSIVRRGKCIRLQRHPVDQVRPPIPKSDSPYLNKLRNRS